jgi:iron complex outermembrane recepter protein
MKQQKYLKVLSLWINLIFLSNISYGQGTLTGKVSDATDKSPLPGATLYFPDLKTGTSTNANGYYELKNLPKGKFSLTIRYVGYNTINCTVEIQESTQKDFELTSGIIESKEFIVTGVSQATERSRTPTPVSLIPKTALVQSAASNLIDAISKQPGISQLSSGQSISKPVIRGLGFNRVVVIHDGIRQEGQQWGDEHGIEIDENSVNSVEILKGPASLTYGSDAMAGVINFIGAPTASEGEIKGDVMTNYQSNNSMLSYSASLKGNNKGFIWDSRFSQKKAGNYQNAYDGKVLNSAFNESTFSGLIGLNKKWGYTHLNFSQYVLNTGLPEGERDSASGLFLKAIKLNDSTLVEEIASSNDLNGYSLLIPRQIIKHSKAVLTTNIVVGNGRFTSCIGMQQNLRQEFGDPLNANQFGLFLKLTTLNYDLRYVLPEKQHLNLSFGVSGMLQTSENKGTEFLIPDYSLFDAGAFLIAKKEIDRLDISGGIRVDTRNQKVNSLRLDSLGVESNSADSSSVLKFNNFENQFLGISGSLGATYQLNSNFLVKLNLSRGFRAPNIAELASNGNHEGTSRYELGNENLRPETSWQSDLQFGFNSEHLSAELDLFDNRIANFIFPYKLQSTNGGDSITEGLSTFKYGSGNADLLGGEFTIDLHPHPLDWLHFENSFSMVNARLLNQPDSMSYLPFSPAARLNSELKATAPVLGKKLKNAFLKIELENYFAQNNIYSAANTETATPGYTLLNAGLGLDFINRNKVILASFYFSVNNITDQSYQSHLNRLKYAPVNNASQRSGIFNMGRNYSVKLIIPFQLRQNQKSTSP